MTAVTICSDFGTQKKIKSATACIVSRLFSMKCVERPKVEYEVHSPQQCPAKEMSEWGTLVERSTWNWVLGPRTNPPTSVFSKHN